MTAALQIFEERAGLTGAANFDCSLRLQAPAARYAWEHENRRAAKLTFGNGSRSFDERLARADDGGVLRLRGPLAVSAYVHLAWRHLNWQAPNNRFVR